MKQTNTTEQSGAQGSWGERVMLTMVFAVSVGVLASPFVMGSIHLYSEWGARTDPGWEQHRMWWFFGSIAVISSLLGLIIWPHFRDRPMEHDDFTLDRSALKGLRFWWMSLFFYAVVLAPVVSLEMTLFTLSLNQPSMMPQDWGELQEFALAHWAYGCISCSLLLIIVGGLWALDQYRSRRHHA